MFYCALHLVLRGIAFWTLRIRRHRLELATRNGGYLLACAHVSHLDPFGLGAIWPRRIAWMARAEFYQRGWSRLLLNWLGAIPVHRQGAALGAMRTGLRDLARGEVVGMFPEGEISSGRKSVLRGGRIKRGVCLLAARSGCPVLPCVIVGTEKLLGLDPWLPAWRGRLWVICGEFIPPVVHGNRRAARAEMAAQLEDAFVRLYAELRERWSLEDSIAP